MLEEINRLCLSRLGRLPNMDNPQGYNDKIQWLKLYDQRPEQITACDKWAVRETVPKVLRIPAKLGVSRAWSERFLKCTHDSGSAIAVNADGEEANALAILKPRLARKYGIGKGEWAYNHVPPQLMTEKRLAQNTDYKVHCVHGEPKWVQVIGGRPHPWETIFDAQGNVLPLHMDEKMRHSPVASSYPGGIAWRALMNVARGLAKPWRYVRVDLYWSDDRVHFGELTFWPRSGCYRSPDEPAFGEMLSIDMTEKITL